MLKFPSQVCHLRSPHTLHIHCTHIAHTLHIHCAYKAAVHIHSLHIHCAYIAHTLHTQGCSAHTLHIHCTYIAHTLHIQKKAHTNKKKPASGGQKKDTLLGIGAKKKDTLLGFHAAPKMDTLLGFTHNKKDTLLGISLHSQALTMNEISFITPFVAPYKFIFICQISTRYKSHHHLDMNTINIRMGIGKLGIAKCSRTFTALSSHFRVFFWWCPRKDFFGENT